MTREEKFREQAATGRVCLNADCPQRAHCLLWQLREYVPQERLFLTSVNPHHEAVRQGRCPVFRSDGLVRMAKGMVHFYDDMPRRVEERVKAQLIERYGRTIYYEYRSGKRLIPPAMQDAIRSACRRCGWEQEPVYDGFEDDYVWD